MMKFEYFYKKKISITEFNEHCEVFISMLNSSERVKTIYDKVSSNNKICFFPDSIENPFLNTIEIGNKKFCDICKDYISEISPDSNLYIDITGFSTPDMLFLIKFLYARGLKKITCLYAEALSYKHKERTRFSEHFESVKDIAGYACPPNAIKNNELLIIDAGYDKECITNISTFHNTSKKMLLFGFPSISPDMFFQNIVNAYNSTNAKESFSDFEQHLFSPAMDPFITAQTLDEYIGDGEKWDNIYIAPLSTKPHALGIALYFLWKCSVVQNLRLVYPYCSKYLSDNTIGVSSIWKYVIELP